MAQSLQSIYKKLNLIPFKTFFKTVYMYFKISLPMVTSATHFILYLLCIDGDITPLNGISSPLTSVSMQHHSDRLLLGVFDPADSLIMNNKPKMEVLEGREFDL